MTVYVLTAMYESRCIIVGVYGSRTAAELAQKLCSCWPDWTYTITDTEVIN